MFYIGDRVMVDAGWGPLTEDLPGTIVAIEGNSFGVQFDDCGGTGHNLGGRLCGEESNSGWWVNESGLTIIEEPINEVPLSDFDNLLENF